MINVLIADDHAIVRGGIKQLFALTPDLKVVAEATCSAEVLERLRHFEIDLVLLDVNMPGVGAVELIARIRAREPCPPVLVFSMHNEPVVATRMIKAGAQGYITKDSEPDILLAAVRKVAAHGKYIDPVIAEKMAFDVSSASDRPLHTLLSERETEILRLLTSGMGVNEIALQISISGKTVSTHKARLLEKLQLKGMADLMRYAIEHNLAG